MAKTLGLWGALTGETDRWLLTVLLSAAFAKLLSLIIIVIAFFGVGEGKVSESLTGYSGTVRELDAVTFLNLVITAPLVESVLLALLIWLLGFKLRLPMMAAVGISALLFIPLHGLTAASIIVLPAFVLWGLIQFNWMARGQGETGFKIVVASHSLANLISIAAWSWAKSLP